MRSFDAHAGSHSRLSGQRRVLITNCSLRGRSGTEIVTLDLALGLRKRGHEVSVFAPLLGGSATILRSHGITATDNPGDLPWRPDIIHGHHNHVVAAALACFAEVPALFVCHTSDYWFDSAPVLPRVRRLCAVDETCRSRLVAETGKERNEIELLLNAVDLDLFSARAALPLKPVRALLLAKNVSHAPPVRAAARTCGLELDEIGPGLGREVDDLPSRLKDYDLVFASARMALEAMAVGCAVIVVDGRGLAGLATSSTFDDWRAKNFGLAALTREPTREAVAAEIARYDAADAALVSHRVRRDASLAKYLDQVENIHEEILADAEPSDAVADLSSTGRFMAQWLRRLGEGTVPENFDHLAAANRIAAEHKALLEHRDGLADELMRVHADREAKQDTADRLIADLIAANADRDAKRAVMDQLVADLTAANEDRATQRKVLDRLAEDLTHANADRDAKQRVIDLLIADLTAANEDRATQRKVLDRLAEDLTHANADRDAKQEVVDQLIADLTAANEDRAVQRRLLCKLRMNLADAKADADAKPRVMDAEPADLVGREPEASPPR